jgi:hypothetical protein
MAGLRQHPRKLSVLGSAALGLAVATLTACRGPSLSKSDTNDTSFGGVGKDGEKLGALLDKTTVYERPSKEARELGYLHAGATVARSKKSLEAADCSEGWYEIAPRGFVCTEKAATLDLNHPTLRAMSQRPRLAEPLPYVYARTTKVTGLFHRADKRGIELEGRLPKSTVLAIVGSWTAPDESNEPQRLGLRLNGTFVKADDLEAAAGSHFKGVELGEAETLPIGWVVRRGVHLWDLDGGAPKEKGDLDYHGMLRLTGRYRTIEDEKYWAVDGDSWVRHRDVTALLPRHEYPDFVSDETLWIDVSIVMGTLVLYEGKKPVFATLVSVGRDRLGDPKSTASTAQGTYKIVEKHITRRSENGEMNGLEDAPFGLLLESGQWIVGTPRHDRFGIEHTDGDIELSPSDSSRLFGRVSPQLPEGWHGVSLSAGDVQTHVHIRK